MPGVQNVIGSHNDTIIGRRALENCTEVGTKSEQEIASEPFAIELI